MFVGHFGAGLAAKKVNSKISLGIYILAAQFIDLIWPILILTGIEKVVVEPGNTAFTPLNFVSYPFSHSLAAVVGWGVLFGIVYYLFKKDWKGSLLLGLLVLSHWVLDLIVHRPDLPLVPGSDIKVGLGMWQSVPVTVIFELAIFAAGIFLFLKSYKEIDSKFGIRFWSLIIFLTLIYFMNIISPPPPTAKEIGYTGLAMWVFVLWGFWIDKRPKKK